MINRENRILTLENFHQFLINQNKFFEKEDVLKGATNPVSMSFIKRHNELEYIKFLFRFNYDLTFRYRFLGLNHILRQWLGLELTEEESVLLEKIEKEHKHALRLRIFSSSFLNLLNKQTTEQHRTTEEAQLLSWQLHCYTLLLYEFESLAREYYAERNLILDNLLYCSEIQIKSVADNLIDGGFPDLPDHYFNLSHADFEHQTKIMADKIKLKKGIDRSLEKPCQNMFVNYWAAKYYSQKLPEDASFLEIKNNSDRRLKHLKAFHSASAELMNGLSSKKGISTEMRQALEESEQTYQAAFKKHTLELQKNDETYLPKLKALAEDLKALRTDLNKNFDPYASKLLAIFAQLSDKIIPTQQLELLKSCGANLNALHSEYLTSKASDRTLTLANAFAKTIDEALYELNTSLQGKQVPQYLNEVIELLQNEKTRLDEYINANTRSQDDICLFDTPSSLDNSKAEEIKKALQKAREDAAAKEAENNQPRPDEQAPPVDVAELPDIPNPQPDEHPEEEDVEIPEDYFERLADPLEGIIEKFKKYDPENSKHNQISELAKKLDDDKTMNNLKNLCEALIAYPEFKGLASELKDIFDEISSSENSHRNGPQ